MPISFIYLFIASAFQLGWLYNLKRIKKGFLKELKTTPFFSAKTFKIILPIILYLIFSIANIVFLAWAMRTIKPSEAYAIWTGIVIGVSAIIDQLISKEPVKLVKIAFLLMIVIGIVGLRLYTPET